MSGKTYKPGVVESITAVAALAANLFIGFDGDVCGANKKALGSSELKADLGEQCPVIITGIALVLSGGAISVEDPLVSDANGKSVPATAFSVTVPSGSTPVTSDAAQPNLVEAGSVLPQFINGYALDAASGADELIRVKLA
jgi:hypothetical protein